MKTTKQLQEEAMEEAFGPPHEDVFLNEQSEEEEHDWLMEFNVGQVYWLPVLYQGRENSSLLKVMVKILSIRLGEKPSFEVEEVVSRSVFCVSPYDLERC